jgi:ABC-type transport system involved in cytochrome c biogenesis permease subunit
LLGLVVEAFQKNGLGVLLSSVAGLVLLLVSGRFADGDTMGVMIAVLDSNFWLSTHVVCITIGYAGCFFAGLFGAAYLIASLWMKPDDARRKAIVRVNYGILAFGLIFAFLGTMLGGVWADQSWGRFWGWDPKENGALLIVIWSTLIFHARICKIISDVGFAAGATLGIIVVLMAWLGINLLGVGLHNYGFTNALAVGFWVGVSVVALFVAAVLPFVKRVPSSKSQIPG